MNNGIMTEQDLIEYREDCGNEAAANLLLLTGPDCFSGDYDDWMKTLTGCQNPVID